MRSRRGRRPAGRWRLRAWTSLSLLPLAACAPPERPGDLLILDAWVIDGTGADRIEADVRVRGDRIVRVGELTPARGERTIDATGRVLAPGFIDTHSHHDRGLTDSPEALAAVSQGVTTIVVGQDGGSALPLTELFNRLEGAPAAVNVASYVGHNTVRRAVMGDDFQREATADEVEAMRALVAEAMDEGALGLSTGLEYDPGIYSAPGEVIALAEEAAARGGRYISHMRSEDRAFFAALEELLEVGRTTGMPVQISHLKLAMKSLWGRAGEVLTRLDGARAEGIDVSADVYPYEFWQSTMTVLFPEREYTSEAARFALDELAPPDGMIIAAFEPEPSYVGMTLEEVAEARGTDPVRTYLDLIAEAREADANESIIARSMAPEDVATFLTWAHTNVSSDGGLAGRHPRGFGAFARVLRVHVRERGDLTLEGAIQRMTGLSARHMGFEDRGVLREGAFADLVLFDPETVADRATPEDPQATSVGIEGVWVNGRGVYGIARTDPQPERLPGRVIRRGGG